jgi:hypothetical protein
MSGIIKIRPRKIAEYAAYQWQGDVEDPILKEMAETYGWTLHAAYPDTAAQVLSIKGRGAGRYHRLKPGWWVVALNTSTGAVAALTPGQFNHRYIETDEPG